MKIKIKEFIIFVTYVISILFYINFYNIVKEHTDNFFLGVIALMPFVLFVDEYVRLKYFKKQ